MQPKTKQEAEEIIRDAERRAAKCDELAAWQRSHHKREHEEGAARHHRSQAARLRELLPTLPEAT